MQTPLQCPIAWQGNDCERDQEYAERQACCGCFPREGQQATKCHWFLGLLVELRCVRYCRSINKYWNVPYDGWHQFRGTRCILMCGIWSRVGICLVQVSRWLEDSTLLVLVYLLLARLQIISYSLWHEFLANDNKAFQFLVATLLTGTRLRLQISIWRSRFSFTRRNFRWRYKSSTGFREDQRLFHHFFEGIPSLWTSTLALAFVDN